MTKKSSRLQAVRRYMRILRHLRKVKLRPKLKVWSSAVGASFVYIEVTWNTLLMDGTLHVVLDNTEDVSAAFRVDDSMMKATATIDTHKVGGVLIDVTADCLARLFPTAQVTTLQSETACYIPY